MIVDYNKQEHCVYYTRYHVVFSTKYRRKIFNSGIRDYLKLIIKRVTDYYPDINILEINTDQDHIHLLISIPPKMSVGKAIGIIKANTATALRKKFDFLNTVYWGNAGVWS